MRQTAISFQSKGLMLEGVLTVPQKLSPPFPALALCPGHPFFKENMDSPLLLALCQELDEQGFACLRFNYRGVGNSEGQFTNGKEEPLDVAAALKVLAAWPGVDHSRLGVVGHSFGASAILTGVRHLKAARALVLLSPTLPSVERSALQKDRRPKLVLVGEEDRIVPPEELQKRLQQGARPLEVQVVPDADHTYRQQEEEAAVRVAHYVSTIL